MVGDHDISQRLQRLASGYAAGERQALAGSLVDLLADLEHDLNPREAALFGDILTKLIRDFETAVRQALAERLARLAQAPHEVILALANDDIEVARPVLRLSAVLSDRDLVAVIQNRSRQHQMSIALRETLGETVCDALVDTGDEAVIVSLLNNANAKISEATLAYLAEEARQVDSFQEPLVRREDLGGELARRLYSFVAEDLRQRILQSYELDPALLDAELSCLPEQLAAPNDISGEAQQGETAFSEPAPARLAEALAGAEEITPEFLVQVLRAGKVDLFEALVGRLSGIEVATLQNLLYDSNGKALASICRALEIPKQTFIEVYLLIRRSRSDSRTTTTRQIGSLVRYFDRIAPASAREALVHWRGGAARERVRHAG